MKTVDELYEKYYNAYKNDYDSDNELSEGKKKKNDCKQFEMFDKIDKELTLDGETKTFIKEIKNREKNVDKKGFTKYFSYEPSTLVNNLLGQNTQPSRQILVPRTSRGRPPPTSPSRSLKILFDRPGDVPI